MWCASPASTGKPKATSRVPPEPKGSKQHLRLGGPCLIIPMNKQSLRQLIRTQRRALSLAQQQEAAEKICTHVTQSNRYRLSNHIAFYLSFENELDPTPLLLQAHQAGKQCYLPVLHPQKIGFLCFLPYQPGDPLIENRFGILEPIYNPKLLFPTWQLEIVFTPLVAFDKQGNRLGMGQGYYDRTFEFLKNGHAPQPYLIGLAYHMQEVAHLETQAHDIRMNEVVTENSN